jgi:hypothetical protein
MNRKRLLTLVTISLFVICVVSVTVVWAFPDHRFETFICRKSVTIDPEELTVLDFYMPSGQSNGIKFEFEIQNGSINYLTIQSSAFESNPEKILQIVNEQNRTIESFLLETDSGIRGKAWNPDNSVYCVDQNWDIFLYNQDTYEKQVDIIISKTWSLW